MCMGGNQRKEHNYGAHGEMLFFLSLIFSLIFGHLIRPITLELKRGERGGHKKRRRLQTIWLFIFAKRLAGLPGMGDH